MTKLDYEPRDPREQPGGMLKTAATVAIAVVVTVYAGSALLICALIVWLLATRR